MTVRGSITPLHDKVFVTNMEFGEQVTKGGIVLTSDDGKDTGIHPRWCQVYAVGPEHKEELGVGDWILMEHGRWSRGIDVEEADGTKIVIRLIDNKCIMLWDDRKPEDTTIMGLIDNTTAPTLSDFGKVL